MACSTQRHYLSEDEARAAQNNAPEKTLESRFTSGFDVKNNSYGVPEANSQKSSPFQIKIDAGRSDRKGNYMTGDYAGINDYKDGRKNFDTKNSGYSAKSVFSNSKNSSFARDKIPAFMKSGRGIDRDENTSFVNRSAAEGSGLLGLPNNGYGTNESRYHATDESGYIESRRDETPKAKIIGSKEYMQRTIEETRSMLGRDDKQSDADKYAEDPMVDESERFTGELGER